MPEHSNNNKGFSDSFHLRNSEEWVSELGTHRQKLYEQEREFDQYRQRLQHEFIERETELRDELDKREKLFHEREQQLMARQRQFEVMQINQRKEVEAARDLHNSEMTKQKAALQAALEELATQKKLYTEESRKLLESKSESYVEDALEILDTKEKEFHSISKVWGQIGAFALIVSIFFFGYTTFSTITVLPHPLTWEFISYAVLKGMIAVGLLGALARYSFLFSNSYMKEALKNADRRHAINYGKFYLASYGAAADWSQVKEAFEHWNTTGSNAFNAKTEPKTSKNISPRISSRAPRRG